MFNQQIHSVRTIVNEKLIYCTCTQNVGLCRKHTCERERKWLVANTANVMKLPDIVWLANAMTGWNGYCASAPCSGARASIAVTLNNAEMTALSPDEAIAAGSLTQELIDNTAYGISASNPNVAEVTMDRNADGVGNTGPFYSHDGWWRDSRACVNAMIDDGHHYFRFKQPSVECGTDPTDSYSDIALPTGNTCIVEKYQLWLPLRHNHDRYARSVEFKAYYIKVAVPSDQLYTVEATTFIDEDTDHSNGNLMGQPYGTRPGCNSNNGGLEGAVCLEVRHPQGSHCSRLAVNDFTETHTLIKVKVTSHQYMEAVDPASTITTVEPSDRSIFAMKLEDINYGHEYGIYRGSSDNNIEEAKERALNSCKNAQDGDYDDSTVTSASNYAVRFEGYDPLG